MGISLAMNRRYGIALIGVQSYLIQNKFQQVYVAEMPIGLDDEDQYLSEGLATYGGIVEIAVDGGGMIIDSNALVEERRLSGDSIKKVLDTRTHASSHVGARQRLDSIYKFV